MEQAQQSNYLISQPIRKLLPKFAIPCVISLIISCLYNIVDQIFVGNGIGFLGNAATGIIFPITVVGWALSLLFGDGAAAYLSLSNGRGDTKNANRAIANSVLMSFLTGCILIAVCYFAGDSLLVSLGATDATLEYARNYGSIIYAMIPLALVQNTLAAIIRADGSPKYAMLAMAVGAILNIIFDPITIFLFHWGIQGAAIATIFGQFVSFAICALYLRRSKTFHLTAKDFLPCWSAIKPVLPLGGSSFLTQLSIVIVTVVNNKLLVSFGAQSEYGADIPLAAFVVIMKLFQIVLNIAIGIAAGAQPIIGFNYGAKRYDRVKETLQLVILWTFITSAIATALFELIPRVFIEMFGADSELYTSFAVVCLQIYLSLIIFTCIQKAISIFLQSIGKAAAAIPLSIIRDVVFLLVFSFILANQIGVTGIFWAAPAADILAMLVTILVLIPIWKKLKHTGKADVTATAMKPSSKGVIVTIAREHGSAGKQIGKLVAQQLGIPFYYKEMTALAAQESGLDKEFISDINANAPAVLHELYLSTTVVQQAVVAQEKIIRKIADNGACVIVGRAADYVLRDNPDVVRVFIHAPKAYREKKVMEMYGDSQADAGKNIRRSDEARAAYYRSISGLSWGDPHNYHLCVDGSMGESACADLICAYVRGR